MDNPATGRKILITGASIAGVSTAFWLSRYGLDVTVVEKAPEFREAGQNIDIRGPGREVIRRMGLEEAALAAGTGEEGTAFIDESGEPAAEIEAGDTEADGPTAEMEILRGDLARLIYEASQQGVDYRFGDSIAAIDQESDGAQVRFASGATERYHAVLIAEGVGSSSRELVFPGENEPRYMDMTIGYFTIPRQADDTDFWRWYHTTEGRSISLRPDPHDTIRAMLTLQKKPEGEEKWGEERQKQYLHERFADAGWQSERVLAGLEGADDFYFEVLRQVHMPRWSNGRVALVGDAAWCVTPLGGLGATLAVVGAYVLAGELSRHDDLDAAFSAYEDVVRPLADERGNLNKALPRLMNPHSRIGVAALHAVLKVATSKPLRELGAHFVSDADDDFALPDYGPAR